MVVGALAGVAVLLAVGTYGYLRWQFDQVERIPVSCAVLRNCGTDDPEEPMNVLLVGSDSREGLPPSDDPLLGSFDELPGQRSDTIIVLRVDPQAPSAALLSIPRDLLVRIAGSTGAPRLINSAFQSGPETLIATINQEFGIEIDHYAQIDFNGFRQMVNAVKGVDVKFATPVRDKVSGLGVAAAGCVRLDGEAALAYVRSRHFEYFADGRWHADGTSDLGRIQRQQDLARVALGVAARSARNPLTLNSLIKTAVNNVKIDRTFSSKDIRRLGDLLSATPADELEVFSIPTLPSGPNLVRKDPDATRVVAAFLNGVASTAVSPGGLSLGKINLASATGDALRPTPGC